MTEESKGWYYISEDNLGTRGFARGPFSKSEIINLIDANAISQNTLVRYVERWNLEKIQ
jgi:hypothetical protein